MKGVLNCWHIEKDGQKAAAPDATETKWWDEKFQLELISAEFRSPHWMNKGRRTHSQQGQQVGKRNAQLENEMWIRTFGPRGRDTRSFLRFITWYKSETLLETSYDANVENYPSKWLLMWTWAEFGPLEPLAFRLSYCCSCFLLGTILYRDYSSICLNRASEKLF